MTQTPRPRPRPGPDAPISPSTTVGTPPRAQSFGWLGAVVTVAGATLLVIAFAGVNWFNGPRPTFLDLRTEIEHFGSQAGLIAGLYFPWLAWTLAVVAVTFALAACIPSPAALALRVFGAVAGFSGVALTLLSIRIESTLPFSTFLQRVESGFYVAAVGFLLVGVGAMIGPRRAGNPLT